MADSLARAELLWNQGIAWPELVTTLRDEGFTKIDCVRVAVHLLRVPLMDAKRLVHHNPAWKEERSADDALHALAAKAAEAAARAGQTERSTSTGGMLENRELAERLVGAVTALHDNDVDQARMIVSELLDGESPERALLLSAGLTAALVDMSTIGDENLLEALGILVT